MRPIDADTLQTALVDEYNRISWYKTREKFYRAIEIVRRHPTISLLPNDPLTPEKLREAGKIELACAFQGEGAYEKFKNIAHQFYSEKTYKFVSLKLDGEPREDAVTFTAEFWEV